jgi:nucleoside-diphosphate-sugar epimerase
MMSAASPQAAVNAASPGEGVLSGLRVIDFATGLAGSAPALYLAEAGAEVLKIARPRPGAESDAVLFRVRDRAKRVVVPGLPQASLGIAPDAIAALLAQGLSKI